MKLAQDFTLWLVRPVGFREPEGVGNIERQRQMTVGSAGNNTNVSPQNYSGVPPKQEQAGEFKAALNNATTSTGASPSSKGTEQSQDTSKSLPIILANRPPINLGNQIGQQGAPSSAGAPPAAAPAPAATKTVPGTSTPLPKDAVVDNKTKEATVQSGDFTVKVKPDRKAGKGEDVRADGAVTHGDIKWSTQFKTQNGKVTSVTVNKELDVQTTYGSKADPAADSAYGRGHIKTDKDAGNGSLRFHEGNHGKDYIDYVKTHPFPTVEIDKPITKQEFDKKMSEFKKQAEQYQKDMEAQSKQHTDDVTDPPAATTPAAAK
jgi:predicted secreted Zn-dependent protease